MAPNEAPRMPDPIAESEDLAGLLDADGRIKDSPANVEADRMHA